MFGRPPKAAPDAGRKAILAAVEEAAEMLNQFRRAKARSWPFIREQNAPFANRRRGNAADPLRSRPAYSRSACSKSCRNCSAARAIDPQRLAQEAALLADRGDIGEKISRLQIHSAPVGRDPGFGRRSRQALDFLLQEMNRETNTILSKTSGLGDLGLRITELALAIQGLHRKDPRAGAESGMMTTVFIISAPSGSGKSTLVHRLLASPEPGLFHLLHHAPAAGAETDGVDYIFISRKDFEERVWRAASSWNMPRFSAIITAPTGSVGVGQEQGKDLVLDIDVQGARQLKVRFRKRSDFCAGRRPARSWSSGCARAAKTADEVIERRLARRGGRDSELQRLRLRSDQPGYSRKRRTRRWPPSCEAERVRKARMEEQKSGRFWKLSRRTRKGCNQSMGDKNEKQRACTDSGRPEQSTYRFIIVAAKRARQLQNGARPVLPTSSKKPTIIAMEEVRRGLVKYDTARRVPEEAPVPEE
jgi:DNA-directed RNA polymerase omega subunit